MPIDHKKYPTNWKEISLRIRAREQFRCKWCSKPQGRVAVLEPGYWWDEPAKRWRNERGEITQYDTPPDERSRRINCILTVAHYPDHDPMNCADDNLQALCQRCHLRADRFYHAENAARTRRAKRIAAGQEEMSL